LACASQREAALQSSFACTEQQSCLHGAELMLARADLRVARAELRVLKAAFESTVPGAQLELGSETLRADPVAASEAKLARAELDVAQAELAAMAVAFGAKSSVQRGACNCARKASRPGRSHRSVMSATHREEILRCVVPVAAFSSQPSQSMMFPLCSPPPSPPAAIQASATDESHLQVIHTERSSQNETDRATKDGTDEVSGEASGKDMSSGKGGSQDLSVGEFDMSYREELQTGDFVTKAQRLYALVERLPLIKPHSNSRRMWIGAVLIASTYTAVVLPLRYGFIPEFNLTLQLLDVVSDCVFLYDFLAHFLLSYYERLALITSRRLICRRYLRSPSFYVNLLSVGPIFACAATSYENCWVRLPVLVRCIQLPFLCNDYINACSDSPFNAMGDARFSSRKLVILAYAFFMMTHLCACFFGAIIDPDVLPLSYSYGVWWSVTALTGFGTITTMDTVPQLFFASVVLSGSLFTSTYIIGNMGVLISNLDPVGVRFRKKRDAADQFVLNQAVPPELASRLHLYLQLVWTRGAGTNLTQVVSQMNATLRKDIMDQICFSVFTAVPMFKTCGERLISSLIETMVMEVFPQHEWVCHRGSISSAMYIVLDGSVSVVIDEERMVVVKRLSRGDFFGERSLFGSERRNASIQAKTTVEVVVLRAETFRRMLDDPLVLAENPTLAKEIEAAKVRREKEMRAARNEVDEFKRDSLAKAAKSKSSMFHVVKGIKKSESTAVGVGVLESGEVEAAEQSGAQEQNAVDQASAGWRIITKLRKKRPSWIEHLKASMEGVSESRAASRRNSRVFNPSMLRSPTVRTQSEAQSSGPYGSHGGSVSGGSFSQRGGSMRGGSMRGGSMRGGSIRGLGDRLNAPTGHEDSSWESSRDPAVEDDTGPQQQQCTVD